MEAMNLAKIKKLNIPTSPGSYQFFGKQGEIIYVGKAINLRSRIYSYWRKSTNHSSAKRAMMKEISVLKWLEVDTEIEALLLEANLIKKYQPRYNIDLRDDKRFFYIKISSEEEVPRVFATRKLDKAGTYFGPFTSSLAVREVLKIIRKIWPYRSCVNLPKKVCLYYRISKCAGMCEFTASREEYQKTIKQIILFLRAKKKKILNAWSSEIRELAKKEKKGGINDKDSNRKKMLEYRLMNIEKILAHTNIIGLIDKYASDVVELAKVLGLPKVPERIEGYDISNIFGRQAVGSMVVFSAGEANKSEYRKFKIKLSEGSPNDIFMLREVLERRLARLIKKDKKWPAPDLIVIDGGKAQLNIALKVLKKYQLDIPILAVSKGKGLRSAQAPDKLFFPGQKTPLTLPLASPALHIIKRVRDEAHRFAIKYHRELRKKKTLNV